MARYIGSRPVLLRDSAMFSVIAGEWPALRATLRARLAGAGGG